VTMAAMHAVSRRRDLAAAARPPGGLFRRNITCMPFSLARWCGSPDGKGGGGRRLRESGGREAAAASAEILISADIWSSGT
jgi:hypothetical protein